MSDTGARVHSCCFWGGTRVTTINRRNLEATRHSAPVAQRIRHRPMEPGIAGSSPAGSPAPVDHYRTGVALGVCENSGNAAHRFRAEVAGMVAEWIEDCTRTLG